MVQSFIDCQNDRIQPVRAVDSTQVRTADRALGCNSLFVYVFRFFGLVCFDDVLLLEAKRGPQ